MHGVMIMLLTALFLTFFRLAKGPSLPDRVVALDLITSLVVGISIVYAMMTDNPVFIRPAIVVALISFLGTVAFAYYIEKRGKP
jgi:multicomponent Na+:H+ antiporter subunit F